MPDQPPVPELPIEPPPAEPPPSPAEVPPPPAATGGGGAAKVLGVGALAVAGAMIAGPVAVVAIPAVALLMAATKKAG